MFSQTAQYYDLIYSFKDYEEESRAVKTLIEKLQPGAQTVLDVACGTGAHAKHLADHFSVDGIDVEPGFIDIASKKVPTGAFQVADMCDFHLGKCYDVVLCLFSSIGYLTQAAQVRAALKCFKSHIGENGLILVEPWFTPDQWQENVPFMLTVDQDDLKLCRMNTSRREGDLSILDFHYLVATSAGVEYFTEMHSLGLYTKETMLSCFNQAGLAVEYDPQGLTGRGLYIARSKNVGIHSA